MSLDAGRMLKAAKMSENELEIALPILLRGKLVLPVGENGSGYSAVFCQKPAGCDLDTHTLTPAPLCSECGAPLTQAPVDDEETVFETVCTRCGLVQ